MDGEQQLRWERDNAQWAAIAAALSAILTIAAGLYFRSKVTGSADDNVEGIILVNDHKSDLLVSAILQAFGTALLAPPLYYLFRATRARREQLPAAIRYLVLGAPVTAAIFSVVHQLQLNDLSDKVVKLLPLPPGMAKDLVNNRLGDGGVVAVSGIGTAAGLGIAFMFILVSLNAMRAGLLSRFMGILGIIVGVLLVIPLQGNLPVVQVFWMGALAALFLDKWPQGRGPAWDSGEAIPWPSAADKRDALTGAAPRPRPARGGWGGRQRLTAPAAPEADDDVVVEEPHTREAARPRPSADHPRSKKRKRKRR
ncbi:MAG: hypothetical protein QOJ57_106 [Thermoleophilaceae bacterium]|nr:hypothetical protein [Thermoleophilaceae bacterium]